ncbi:hypothetical protein [Salsuginibacillus kocurii]|uniref:hypothetical protein n=1 Tax=Salsuginibacillus kocurii TaxID=427078 RepID=UPI001969C196|nr:hypothetical protein [Salsuginibacillus kocurii]
MYCPNCSSKQTGKIGVYHYYCWNCCIEWRKTNDGVSLFQVDQDGSLDCLDDLFSEAD